MQASSSIVKLPHASSTQAAYVWNGWKRPKVLDPIVTLITIGCIGNLQYLRILLCILLLYCAWTRILQQMEENFQVQLETLNKSFFTERDAMIKQHSEIKKVYPKIALNFPIIDNHINLCYFCCC